jgi:hypothetical protein
MTPRLCRCACGCQREVVEPHHRQLMRCRGCRWNPTDRCAQTKYRKGSPAWIEAKLTMLAAQRKRARWTA